MRQIIKTNTKVCNNLGKKQLTKYIPEPTDIRLKKQKLKISCICIFKELKGFGVNKGQKTITSHQIFNTNKEK